jgi:transcriptional regulator with GAF, ATPase, and Fis domain
MAWRIRKTLAECENNETEAARRLGYNSRSALRYQLRRLGIKGRSDPSGKSTG